MKTRLLGALVLIALIVIFVPMFFSSNPSSPQAATGSGDQSVSLAIPPAQDSNLQTRTMSLAPDAPAASGSVVAPATAGTAAQGNQLATVNIASRKPTDVGTDAAAPKPQPTGPALGSGAPGQPVIPLQAAGGAPATPGVPPPVVKTAAKPAATPVTTAAIAAPVAAAAVAAAPSSAAGSHGIFVLNLSAYANAASVDHLVRRVRGMGFPVLTRIITQGGKQLTLVTAGPFQSRAAAEAARLKIVQTVPGVPATLEQGLGHDGSAVATAPAAAGAAVAHMATPAATPAAAPRAGGYAVQLAALGSEADANALRDKLRGAGFDSFVDSVSAGGKRLWRVRAGPQTQRADAERLRDQIKAKLGIGGNVVSVP